MASDDDSGDADGSGGPGRMPRAGLRPIEVAILLGLALTCLVTLLLRWA